MNNKRVEEILGTNNRTWENKVKDSDKDGVSNMLDCKPRDPNKQGVIHDVGKRVGEYRAAWRQRQEATRQIRAKARAAGYKEREKQEIRVAEEREKIKAKKRIEYEKSGGFWGSVGRGVTTVSKQVGQATKAPRAPVRRMKGKRKKSKRKTRTTYSKPKPPQKYDIMGGGSFI